MLLKFSPLVSHHVDELLFLGADVGGQMEGLAHHLGEGEALHQLVGHVHQVPAVCPSYINFKLQVSSVIEETNTMSAGS
jgi:hypothetical protein